MSTPMNEKGLQICKEMFGAAFVEQQLAEATDFTRPFLEMVTSFAFGEVWSRPGLERKTRSMLTLAMLVALNRPQELRLHVKGALANGVSKDEMREIILQGVPYCGFPAAYDAFRTCAETLKALGVE